MTGHRKTPEVISVFLRKAFCRPCLFLLSIPLLPFVTTLSVKAQSSSTPPAQSQTQSQNQSQTSSQPQTPAQADSGNNQQSLADAARKANADKEKPKAKHVFTEDDLSSLHGTISVVGGGSSGGGASGGGSSSGSFQGSRPAPAGSRGGNDEAYWRGRARQIKDQIAETDQKIDKVKDEIAKQGPAGVDPTTGLTQNVIIIHDRNAELKDLEERKQNLEKQLDDLADEGRKAGADSGWFR